MIHLKCSLNGSWRNNFLNRVHNSALTKSQIVRWKRRADAKVPVKPALVARYINPPRSMIDIDHTCASRCAYPAISKRDGLPFRKAVVRRETAGGNTMTTTVHKKAAELHQNAPKAHLAAADSHAKGDAAKGTKDAKVAQQHSQPAAKRTDQASAKSQQHK